MNWALKALSKAFILPKSSRDGSKTIPTIWHMHCGKNLFLFVFFIWNFGKMTKFRNSTKFRNCGKMSNYLDSELWNNFFSGFYLGSTRYFEFLILKEGNESSIVILAFWAILRLQNIEKYRYWNPAQKPENISIEIFCSQYIKLQTIPSHQLGEITLAKPLLLDWVDLPERTLPWHFG